MLHVCMYFWPLVLFLFGLDLAVRVVKPIVHSRSDLVLILGGQISNLEHDIYKVLRTCTNIHVRFSGIRIGCVWIFSLE